MYHYLIPILEKKPEHLILHVGTNDAVDSSHQQIVNDLLTLKQFIKEKLQNCNVILSMPTKRCNSQKAYATVNLVNQQLSQLNIDIIENNNISDKHLDRDGLHLTNHGRVRLAMIFIWYVKKPWRFYCSRGCTLYNLSQNPSNDSYTKGSVRTSGNKIGLDIDGLTQIRVNNSFNPIVGYLNINSLRNKTDDICKVFWKVQTDILCIDETKLDDSFPDSHSKINGYKFPFLRRDRERRKNCFYKTSPDRK